VDAGVRDASAQVVVIHGQVDAGGRITRAEVADTQRLSDPAYRQAAERALRALMNPRCNQLPLQPDRIAQAVREGFVFRFDPGDMF